jgi:tetratricopeptide (TPR) repeat protein
MNLLSAQEIAARLDRRFSLLTDGSRTALPRHQTLLAAIEWSHDLLSEPERVLFYRLSVFAGSFILEAAEAICAGDPIRREEVLTLVGRLVDKSLLTVEPNSYGTDLPTRFRFLDTIYSFGRLKLDEAEETRQMRDRHAEYYVRLVETVEPELLSQNQVHWHNLLQAENDNLRAVFEWSSESAQAESALRLVGALLWFWFSIGSSREGLELTLTALSAPSAVHFHQARARALNTAGYLQWVLGDATSAKQLLEEALSILKISNDESSLAWLMQILGLVHTSEGNYDLANTAMNDGVAISQKLGDYKSSVFSLAFQGDIALQQGDRSKAIKIYKESAHLLREFGNRNFLAYPMRRLGYLALEQNDIPLAWDYFHESLTLNHEVGDKRAFTASLVSMAALALHLDKLVVAARLYGVVESRLEALSTNLLYLDQAELGCIRDDLLACLNEAIFAAAFAEGWELSEEQAIAMVGEIVGDEN